MKKSKLILAGLAIFSVSFTSCKEDDDQNPSVSGPGIVTLEISNVAGTVNVDETGATSYINSSGESFTVRRLKYYISNVRLYNGDALVYSMPESYFLVDESNNATTKLSIPNVPAGNYTKIQFMLGVDSTRNVSGTQSGALDPANGMFWTWSTGYIFYKLEGKSPASTQADSSFIYHIGGFKNGNNTNATREVEIVFGGNTLIVDGNRDAEIHVFADVLKVFSSPNTIEISVLDLQMGQGGNALLIADNYANMFTFDHLHNN